VVVTSAGPFENHLHFTHQPVITQSSRIHVVQISLSMKLFTLIQSHYIQWCRASVRVISNAIFSILLTNCDAIRIFVQVFHSVVCIGQ